MTIKQAVKMAIDGGFLGGNPENWSDEEISSLPLHTVLLNPLFWQSLGEAIGWENESECPLACCGGICPIDIPMWQSQWHRFIDKLSNGVTAEQFFEEL